MPYFLGAFCIIPVGGTFYRLAQIIQEGQWWPRFNPEVVDNFPLFIHGVSMVIFLVLGALQFLVTGPFAQRQLHRILGCIAVLGAVIGGLSGMWMTLAHVGLARRYCLLGGFSLGLQWQPLPFLPSGRQCIETLSAIATELFDHTRLPLMRPLFRF